MLKNQITKLDIFQNLKQQKLSFNEPLLAGYVIAQLNISDFMSGG